jgi:hypothetical protein
MESSRNCGYDRCMAYDEKGRPIVDGKPFDEIEYAENAFLEGLKLDGHELKLARLRRLKARAEKDEQEDEVVRLEKEIQTAIRSAPSKVCKVCGQAKFGQRIYGGHWESLCEEHIKQIDAEMEGERLAKLDPLRRALGKSRKPKLQLGSEINAALEELWPALNRIYKDLPGFRSVTVSSATWRSPILRFQVEPQGHDGSPLQHWRIDLKEGIARCDFHYSTRVASSGGSRIRAAGGRIAIA